MRDTGVIVPLVILMGQERSTSRKAANPRGFWETYTLRNIVNEIKFRLSSMRRPGPAPHVPANQVKTPVYDGSHAQSVGHFYDSHHDQFMKVYGEVIQALRTKNITDLLDHQIKSIGFRPHQHVLDAGCGISAPAIYFAAHANVHVDAITISRVQYEVAQQKIDTAGLGKQVRVVQGDYHNLSRYFSREAYDIVYFLESFGHSTAKRQLIESAWEMLKPGGVIYIKDLFRRIPLRPEHQERIDREILKINAAYHYEVGDLNAVLNYLRGKGFVLTSLKSIDLELEGFEDLAISNEFQELTGLALIENWNEYVFPVDFFEIKCAKPEFDLEARLDRHFLQNRYHQHLESQAKNLESQKKNT